MVVFINTREKVCNKLTKYIYYGMNYYRTNAGSENLLKKTL
jgi:hypothetical protein